MPWVYFKTQSDAALDAAEAISEYTLEMHQGVYQAIRHIQVKQQQYLGTELTTVGH